MKAYYSIKESNPPHYRTSWYDALSLARGDMACILESSRGTEKIHSRGAEKILRNFACDCGERILERSQITDMHLRDVIHITRMYNAGMASLGEVNTRVDAAWYAARKIGGAAWAVRDIAWAVWGAACAASRASFNDLWSIARESGEMNLDDAAWAYTMDSWDIASRYEARHKGDNAWYIVRDIAAVSVDREISWQKRHLNKLMKELFAGDV